MGRLKVSELTGAEALPQTPRPVGPDGYHEEWKCTCLTEARGVGCLSAAVNLSSGRSETSFVFHWDAGKAGHGARLREVIHPLVAFWDGQRLANRLLAIGVSCPGNRFHVSSSISATSF
jgi:hypothetical protein